MAKWNPNLPPKLQGKEKSDNVFGKFQWEQDFHYEVCFYNYVSNEWIDSKTAKLISKDSEFIGWRSLE